MLGDFLGSMLGASPGAAMRRRWVRAKAARIARGDDFAVFVRCHASGAPDWRTERRVLRRRSGQLRLHALIRRWRSLDASALAVIGDRVRRSAADGAAVVLELKPGLAIDQVLLPVEFAPGLLPLFPSAYGDGPRT